jgi:hypothetical protein
MSYNLNVFQASKKPKPTKKLDKAASNFLDTSGGDGFASKKAAEKPKPKPKTETEKPKPKPKPAKKKEAWMSSDDDDDKFGGDANSDSDSDFGYPKKKSQPAAKPKPKSPKHDFGDSGSDDGASWQPSKALKSSNGDMSDDGDEFDALVVMGAKKPEAGKKRPAPTSGKLDCLVHGPKFIF